MMKRRYGYIRKCYLRIIYLKEIFGTRNASDEVTFSATFYPNFFGTLQHLFVIWLVESSIICKSHRLNNRTVVICYFLQTNKTVRRLPCLWTTTVLRDVVIVALGVHVVVVHTWRHLWTKSRRQGVFWWGDGRRRSWPMYRWKFSFKPWISSPSQCVFHRGFTEASSRLVPNQPPGNRTFLFISLTGRHLRIEYSVLRYTPSTVDVIQGVPKYPFFYCSK